MTIIATETFQIEATDADGWERGSVEVTIRSETRRVPATRVAKLGWLIAYGVVGRYQTGTKSWPASIRQTMRADGTASEYVSFGRDDRASKFRKENSIWFKN